MWSERSLIAVAPRARNPTGRSRLRSGPSGCALRVDWGYGVTVTVRLIRLRATRLRPALQRRQTTAAASLQTGEEGRGADRPTDRLALAQPRRRLAILGGDRIRCRGNP